LKDCQGGQGSANIIAGYGEQALGRGGRASTRQRALLEALVAS